ncbi:MAG: EF-hand domain-containing protein [Sphingobium sp.]|jgi:hypothetical protein
MIRNLMLVSAFALAAPAFAQQTQPPQEPATESTATQPPAEAQTAPEATTPSATTTPSPAPAEAAPANSANTVAAVVDNDFPAFDADKNGELSKEEFAAWMTKLRAAQPNAAAASTDTTAWTEAAFAQADTDKNKSVSKGELTTFLQG